MSIDQLDLDQRKFPRKSTYTPAILTVSGSPMLRATTLDLSKRGACFDVPLKLQVGQKCLLHFEIVLNGEKKKIGVTAKVMYARSGETPRYKTGFEFVDIHRSGNLLIDEFLGVR